MSKQLIHFVKIGSCIFTLIIGVCFFVQNASAAGTSLYFDTPTETIGVGDEFSVSLMLNSGDVEINTISGELTFSDPLLTLQKVTTGNSIVPFWVQSPVVSGNAVTFSGIIPGGYKNVVNPITNTRSSATVLTLIFKAVRSGSATIVFSDSHLYLNDGYGTEADVNTMPYTIAIAQKGSNRIVPVTDITIPEAFTPIVAKSEELFDGAYAVFFSTTDKDSGIDHYEVSEGGTDWVIGNSPYLLRDQTLKSKIRIKAVDGAGNYRIEQIDGRILFDKKLILIPIACILIVLLALFIMYKRKIKKIYKFAERLHLDDNQSF